MQADKTFHGINTEPPPRAGREQRLVGATVAFGKPAAQDGLGGGGQGNSAAFPVFAEASDAGSVAECDVTAVESDQFGHPQSGLDGD